MAGGSRPNRPPTARAACPAGTTGAAGGAAAGGGGGVTPPPGDVRFAAGGGMIGVGLPGGGTLGIGAGGMGASSPGNRLRTWADAAPGQADAKTQRHAATRQARTPKLP